MNDDERCYECGSYGVECGSPNPVEGCGCARCLSCALTEERKQADRFKAEVEILKQKLEVFDLWVPLTAEDHTWEKERAAVVAWLCKVSYNSLSNEIEHGEHWPAKGNKK